MSLQCRFKSLGTQELKNAILAMDESVIDAEGARGLASFAPTAEEVLVMLACTITLNLFGVTYF